MKGSVLGHIIFEGQMRKRRRIPMKHIKKAVSAIPVGLKCETHRSSAIRAHLIIGYHSMHEFFRLKLESN